MFPRPYNGDRVCSEDQTTYFRCGDYSIQDYQVPAQRAGYPWWFSVDAGSEENPVQMPALLLPCGWPWALCLTPGAFPAQSAVEGSPREQMGVSARRRVRGWGRAGPGTGGTRGVNRPTLGVRSRPFLTFPSSLGLRAKRRGCHGQQLWTEGRGAFQNGCRVEKPHSKDLERFLVPGWARPVQQLLPKAHPERGVRSTGSGGSLPGPSLAGRVTLAGTGFPVPQFFRLLNGKVGGPAPGV